MASSKRLTWKDDRERARFNDDVVKPFYFHEEDYDWTDAADRWVGLETLMHRWREREMVRLLRRHDVAEPMLDVGCGSGLMLRHLPPGSHGIDYNPRNIDRARRYAPRAVVQQGDAEALPYADETFATVVCTEVLEHLVFPDIAIGEMFRVLKPGGTLLGSVPRKSVLWRLRNLSSTCPVGEPFHHEMPRRDLTRLLAPLTRVRMHTPFWGMHFFFVAQRP